MGEILRLAGLIILFVVCVLDFLILRNDMQMKKIDKNGMQMKTKNIVMHVIQFVCAVLVTMLCILSLISK